MTGSELTTAAIGIHASALVAGLAAYPKYGDRSGLYAESLRGADRTLVEIRRIIGGDLARTLKPIIERGYRNPELVPESHEGSSYIETVTNPVGGELYLESVRAFVVAKVGSMHDYGRFILARSGWCSWARRLSWCLLYLLFWEAISAALAFAAKVFDMSIPDWLIQATFLPSTVLVLAIFFSLAMKLRRHDELMHYREEYDKA